MNSKDLLNAIGDTDDRFVEEAAPSERQAIRFGRTGTAGSGSAGNTAGSGRKILKTNWKQWAGGIAAVLAVCVLGAAVIPALFGGAKSAAKEALYYDAPQAVDGNGFNYAADMSTAKEDYDLYSKNEEPEAGGSASLVSSSVAQLNKNNLKLIYTANMTLQTSDYDASEKAISALVTRHNGYFESVKVNNSAMYSANTYKSGYYTVRIPAESYEAFVNAIGNECHVASLSQSVQDVGESYFELEGRLETLYTKQERLQELLKQAANMVDIIELENALSDTEYQIDNYKGQLNHYDSLIGYSTVYITLETVTRPGDGLTQDTSFGARIARAFKNGLRYTANNIEDFIIWIASNIIGIIIFAIIVILLIRFRPLTKLWRKIRKKS